VGITFGRLSSSYWIDNLDFLLRENLTAIFITPSSWGSQLSGHLLGINTLVLLGPSRQSHINRFTPRINHLPLCGNTIALLPPASFLVVAGDNRFCRNLIPHHRRGGRLLRLSTEIQPGQVDFADYRIGPCHPLRVPITRLVIC
jgi:hypothetical protein